LVALAAEEAQAMHPQGAGAGRAVEEHGQVVALVAAAGPGEEEGLAAQVLGGRLVLGVLVEVQAVPVRLAVLAVVVLLLRQIRRARLMALGGLAGTMEGSLGRWVR
jgi:hypothetical protein